MLMSESSAEPNNQCFNCGKIIAQKVSFCPHCRAPLPSHGSLVVLLPDLLIRLVIALVSLGMAVVGGVLGVEILRPGAIVHPILFPIFVGLALLALAGYLCWVAIAILRRK
jgi:hypothetical protein